MDTSGFSQVGRYGTISLMKPNESNAAITAFGIDTEELTFGRDPTCSVRLYYPDVSLVHCKIVFEERKVCIYGISYEGLFTLVFGTFRHF
jgi:FHA domain